MITASIVDCSSAERKVELAVTVCDLFEAVDLRREEWDQLVLDVGGDLYVTYDWCRIWWRHYGKNRNLRLYIFRAAGRLVGLAPMFVEHVGIGPLGLKLAKRVGADFALTIFGLPLARDYAGAAYKELVVRLIDDEKCDAIWFGYTPGSDPTAADMRDAFQSLQSVVVIARDTAAGPHTLFNLPASFGSYLASLDKRQRTNYRRDIGLLNKNFEISGDVVKERSEALEAFERFREMHTAQWQAEGKPGHFNDWPESELFNVDLVSELSRLGRFRLIRMFADKTLVGAQYAFVFGDCCYWRLPARTVNDELKRFALGRLGLMQLIETMIDENVRRIEAGMGHYEYKLRLRGEELMYRSMLLAANRRSAILRCRIFMKVADVLHLMYYRIWRLRLASRLGVSQGLLWRMWIRYRI